MRRSRIIVDVACHVLGGLHASKKRALKKSLLSGMILTKQIASRERKKVTKKKFRALVCKFFSVRFLVKVVKKMNAM